MRELVSNSTKLTTEHSALPGVKRPRFPVKNIHKSALSRSRSRSRALKKKKKRSYLSLSLYLKQEKKDALPKERAELSGVITSK